MQTPSLSSRQISKLLSDLASEVAQKGYEVSYITARIDTHDPDYMTTCLYYRINSNTDTDSVYKRLYFDTLTADLADFTAQCRVIEPASEGRRTQAIKKLAKLTEELAELEIDEELIMPIFDKIKEMSGSLLTDQSNAPESAPKEEENL